jgi:lipopolysaccharide exporter
MSTNVIIQIIAFGLSPIISRMYTAEEFGHLAVFMSIAGFFIIFATSRFELALILPEEDDEAHALIKLSFLINLIISMLSFLLVYFFKDHISNYYQVDFSLTWVYLLPFIVFFSASFFILINYSNRLKNYNSQAISQAVLGISNPISTIVLAAQNGFQFGMIKAVFISNFLASIFLSKELFRHKVFYSSVKLSKVFKKYYHFPLYNLPPALVNFLSNSLPIFLLTPAFGDMAIGFFTMALGKVFKPINLFGGSIYQVLSKKIIDNIQNGKPIYKQVVKLIKTLILVGIIPFVLLFIFAPTIFSFIWGEEWFQSGVYLRYLLPWLFFVYLVGGLSFMPNVLKEQKNALGIEIVHLILRFIVLFYGVYLNDIKLALILYSAVGVVVLSFTLTWYLVILKKNDIAFIKLNK